MILMDKVKCIYTKGIQLNASTPTIIELPFVAHRLHLQTAYDAADVYVAIGKTPSQTEGYILTRYTSIMIDFHTDSFQAISSSGNVYLHILAKSYEIQQVRDNQFI